MMKNSNLGIIGVPKTKEIKNDAEAISEEINK